MMSASFRRMATALASTQRGAAAGGKFGAPAAHLSGLQVLPVMPADPSFWGRTLEREGMPAPHELKQTMIAGNPDVREGDVLVIGAASYPIKAVAEWSAPQPYLVLLLEELKP